MVKLYFSIDVFSPNAFIATKNSEYIKQNFISLKIFTSVFFNFSFCINKFKVICQ